MACNNYRHTTVTELGYRSHLFVIIITGRFKIKLFDIGVAELFADDTSIFKWGGPLPPTRIFKGICSVIP